MKDAPPYVLMPVPSAEREASIDFSTSCPVFQERGECGHGLRCRFLGCHIQRGNTGKLELVTNDEKVARRKLETTELNYIGLDILKQIRSKKVSNRV